MKFPYPLEAWWLRRKEQKSGYFELPQHMTCRDPQHEPPTHILIPNGMGYRHVCPQCGRETILTPSETGL